MTDEQRAKLERIAEVMRDIRADCEADAKAVDSTPFTPKGVGETFGSMLAMIDALAGAVEALSRVVVEGE